jgi:hypothetical protein
MIRRRAAKAGIETKIGCHTFRATGITIYLTNGGDLEKAATDGGAVAIIIDGIMPKASAVSSGWTRKSASGMKAVYQKLRRTSMSASTRG